MSTCLLLIDDGREECRKRTIDSAAEYLPRFEHLVEVDDSAHELGFAGAIAEGWRRVRETKADWVFHLEGDFVFNAEIPVERMQAVLARRPKLAQLALKRQAWNEREKAAGGIVELHPGDFTQITDRGDVWTEHRRYWTTNPSLYSTNWCAQPWPQEAESEGNFTLRLLDDRELRFGIWGAKFDPPLCEHIGTERAGHGY